MAFPTCTIATFRKEFVIHGSRLPALKYQLKINDMYRKLKISLILIATVVMASFFISCSNDEISYNYDGPNKGETDKAGQHTFARQANPNLHSLYIINNSGYNYEISVIGAQTNLEVYDNIEIMHKNRPAMVIAPGQKVAFYDYKRVSDIQYLVPDWEVYNNALDNAFVGLFTPQKMAELYGMLSQPENPASERFPIWKYLSARVVNTTTHQALSVLSSNNPEALSLVSLGNFAQGYNTEIRYGTYTEFGENARAAGIEVPLVTVRWKQSSPDLRATGEVKITIDNVVRR